MVRRAFFRYLSVGIATVFHLSAIPYHLTRFLSTHPIGERLRHHKLTGAGLLGSAAGIATYLVIPTRIGSSWWAVSMGVGIAVLSSHWAEKILGVKDDPRIIIDEWIGAWIAVWGFIPGINDKVILGFILFRVFDVWKGPWGRAVQRLPGGWGVCLDDVLAGIFANVLVRVLEAIVLSL